MVDKDLNNYIVINLPTLLEKSIDELLQSEFHEEKTIGELFGGSIRITLDKNLF